MYQYIEFLGKKISTYTIFAVIGILFCGFLLFKKCKKENIDITIVLEISLFGLLGAYIFSHLLYGITNYDKVIILITHLNNVTSFKLLCDCLYEIFGGSVFYGGLLGGILTGYTYCKIKKYDIKKYSNIISIYIPLFHCFGRIGCFFMGCCYGIESSIGIVYPIHEGNNIIYKSIIPVQLLEAICNLIIFIYLNHLYKIGKTNILTKYLLIYALVRFFLEFLRGDIVRGFIFIFSTSQFISLVIIIIICIKKFLIRKCNF